MTYAALPRLVRTLRAVALLAAAALPLAAQGGGASAPGFHRIDDYVLVLDGKPVKSAQMFQSEQPPAILIMSSSLPSPVVLRPPTKTVETVSLMKVAKQADGTVKLLPGSTLAQQGVFTYGNGEVAFLVDGRKAVLREKPSLLGPQTSAAIRAYSPSYGEGARVYQPDKASVATLKKAAAPVTVRVFFGSWCPHCQQSLPKLFRVEDELKGTKVRFEYFGVPKKGMANVPEFKKLALDGVPSGVVYVNGREVGRILGGNAWETPEVTLSSIVASSPAKANKAKGR